MPILETSDNVTPRSVLRHRPIVGDTAKSEPRTTETKAATPVVQRASRPRPQPKPTEGNDEVAEWQRVEGDDEGEIQGNRSRDGARRISGTASNPLKTPRL